LAAKITPKGVTLTFVHGILIIDKPAGITSHDVVARVRRALKTKRVGHTGTLDPFATGVVVVLVGKATRLAQFLDKDEKEYEAEVKFGWETDTGDNTGLRTADCGLRIEEISERLASVDWEEVFAKFRGTIDQVPPMYSAKKVEGQKLYELARKGVEIDRKAVAVTIHKLEIVDTETLRTPQSAVRIQVVCSAGTYIRTLAEEIGRATGLQAHLTALRRTRAGKSTLEQAVTLDALAEHDSPGDLLLPIENAVPHLPAFTLNEDRVGKTLSGMSTRDLSGRFADGEIVAMFSSSGELIAVGRYMDEEKAVQPKVVLG
jgi:tRNA pseudouridine55 synthase